MLMITRSAIESQSIAGDDHEYAGIQAVTFGLDDIYDEDNLGRCKTNKYRHKYRHRHAYIHPIKSTYVHASQYYPVTTPTCI